MGIFSSDDTGIELLKAEILSLREDKAQLIRILQCLQDPNLCPCGGYMNDWHSHATNCKEICENGRNYWAISEGDITLGFEPRDRGSNPLSPTKEGLDEHDWHIFIRRILHMY